VLSGYAPPLAPVHVPCAADHLLPKRAIACMDFIGNAFSGVAAMNATA
jgi:hypothetical protein